MTVSQQKHRWLLFIFSLPAQPASPRVEIWRKLRRYGALPLPSSGHLLPCSPENLERFEWLAAAIRKYKGAASVVRVTEIDDLPNARLVQLFIEARSKEYQLFQRELRKLRLSSSGATAQLSRLRRRFHEIAALDFFNSPWRSRVEALLETMESGPPQAAGPHGRSAKKEFQRRLWVTRPRPGIDRVASAWLIKHFIDSKAKFMFFQKDKYPARAVPFDTFHAEGFGHRGDDCTFETLRKEFGIRDPKIAALAEIIHDADLGDDKFARTEGLGLDRVLIGWAQKGLSDEELLRRGMDLIEGLYHALQEKS